ncbi:MAG: hypothetical protein HY369_02330 [Candidatus Aenigmarchaeota archaeon]|nr:hypothetical protein [Candidatus Aenigmarchaeota archaeon]
MTRRSRRTTSPALVALPAVIALALLAAFLFLPSGGIVRAGEPIHWHARLDIVINGEEIPIPAGVGLPEGRPPAPTHTHDWDNIIHTEAWEPQTLGSFFDTWGVVFTDRCLFQYCDEDYEMFVNGQLSRAFARYIPQDGDIILIVLNTL